MLLSRLTLLLGLFSRTGGQTWRRRNTPTCDERFRYRDDRGETHQHVMRGSGTETIEEKHKNTR